MSFQLSGIASGMDWQGVVAQLIEIERLPQRQMEADKQEVELQVTGYEQLSDRLEELQEAIDALAEDDNILAKSFSLSGPDSGIFEPSVGPETPIGNYEFDITRIATQTERVGSGDVGAGISATADVSGLSVFQMRTAAEITEGRFAVNGQTVEFELTDSLQDVFDRISTATGGDVTAAYNATTDQIELTSASPIILGSSADTSNFLSATRLFSNGTGSVNSESAIGVVDVEGDTIENAGLAAAVTAVDGDGVGSFSINGISIEYDIDSDTLRDVMDRINGSEANVEMSYDPASDRFRLINRETGSLGLEVSESAGGLLEALGVYSTASTTLGDNARFSINGGGEITSTSNSFDSSVHGVSGLNVRAQSIGTDTVTVSPDTSSIRSKIDTFIEKYNAVQGYIDASTEVKVSSDGEVTTNVFSGDREIDGIGSQLRSLLFQEVSGMSGAIKRLQDIGIDFSGESRNLTVSDATALDDAIRDNSQLVASLFNDETDGLSKRLSDYIETLVESDGFFDKQTGLANDQIDRIELQIDDFERYVTFREDQMTDAFIAMEMAQLQINNQMQTLTNSFFS